MRQIGRQVHRHFMALKLAVSRCPELLTVDYHTSVITCRYIAVTSAARQLIYCMVTYMHVIASITSRQTVYMYHFNVPAAKPANWKHALQTSLIRCIQYSYSCLNRSPSNRHHLATVYPGLLFFLFSSFLCLSVCLSVHPSFLFLPVSFSFFLSFFFFFFF